MCCPFAPLTMLTLCYPCDIIVLVMSKNGKAQTPHSEVTIRIGGVEVKATGDTRDEALRAILVACAQVEREK